MADSISDGSENQEVANSQFDTVAHRGHATYIFISRDKKTVYRAIN